MVVGAVAGLAGAGGLGVGATAALRSSRVRWAAFHHTNITTTPVTSWKGSEVVVVVVLAAHSLDVDIGHVLYHFFQIRDEIRAFVAPRKQGWSEDTCRG